MKEKNLETLEINFQNKNKLKLKLFPRGTQGARPTVELVQ